MAQLRQLMAVCLVHKPEDRPSFRRIEAMLEAQLVRVVGNMANPVTVLRCFVSHAQLVAQAGSTLEPQCGHRSITALQAQAQTRPDRADGLCWYTTWDANRAVCAVCPVQ